MGTTTMLIIVLMLCLYLQFSAQINTIKQGILNQFEISFNKQCVNDENLLTRFLVNSLDICIEECDERSTCFAVSFRRNFNLCTIIRLEDGDFENLWVGSGPCVLGKKSIFQLDVAKDSFRTICNCSSGQKCNHESESCSVQECGPIFNDGVVVGNMNAVGSRVKISCSAGVTYTTCQPNGTWSDYSKCKRVATLGHNCQDDGQCAATVEACLDRRCFCSSLYHYDSATSSCVKAYSALTTTFKTISQTRIEGYNIQEHVLKPSLQDCKDACLAQPKCLSFEARQGPGSQMDCNWNKISEEMAKDAHPVSLVKDSTYTLYTRTGVP